RKTRSLAAGGLCLRQVVLRPLRDLAGATDDVLVIEHEDRHASLSAQLLDLRSVVRPAGPGPELECSAFDLSPLVSVPGIVECFRGLPARVRERTGHPSERLAVAARVEDHTRTVARLRRPRRSATAR